MTCPNFASTAARGRDRQQWAADACGGVASHLRGIKSSSGSLSAEPFPHRDTSMDDSSPFLGYCSLSSDSEIYNVSSPESCSRSSRTKPRRTRSKNPSRQRQNASEKEKLRMRDLTKALHHLRTFLPPSVAPAGQTLTKIETLRLAIRYISHLSAQLHQNSHAGPSHADGLRRSGWISHHVGAGNHKHLTFHPNMDAGSDLNALTCQSDSCSPSWTDRNSGHHRDELFYQENDLGPRHSASHCGYSTVLESPSWLSGSLAASQCCEALEYIQTKHGREDGTGTEMKIPACDELFSSTIESLMYTETPQSYQNYSQSGRYETAAAELWT
ncbi:mesoderm posterior bb [Trichomycterus rosablanca]|uniref:mesoderm posterior bb n=1 Tax=Trichomycterus rosablanca TaxID=2290929 RepID=UPI002F3517E7